MLFKIEILSKGASGNIIFGLSKNSMNFLAGDF